MCHAKATAVGIKILKTVFLRVLNTAESRMGFETF